MSDKPQILIADDEPAMRKLLAFCCETLGYATTLAANGLDALDHACTTSYHLIITDYQMPRMNGIELCRHLRRYERHVHTPLILCSSALDQLDTQALRKELGLITFVSKPINLLSLPRQIRAYARLPADALRRDLARVGSTRDEKTNSGL